MSRRKTAVVTVTIAPEATMKLFGTDGIRGKAGVAPLEPADGGARRRGVGEVGLRAALTDGSAPHRFVIGRDTRESGEWIEAGAGARPDERGRDGRQRRRGADAGGGLSGAHGRLRRGHRDLRVAQSVRRQRHQGVCGARREARPQRSKRSVEALVADASWMSVPAAAGARSSRRDLSDPYLDAPRADPGRRGPARRVAAS